MIAALACLAAMLFTAAPQASPHTARAAVTRAIDALGGEAALRNIRALEIESIGHTHFVDQSERPEGPFIVTYVSVSEKRDVASGRSRTEEQQRFVLSPDWSAAGATIVDADAAAIERSGRSIAAGRQTYEDGRERLELAPERLLFTALAAPDLAMAPAVTLHGILQQVVTFTWRGRHARLLIDGHDDVPSALELRADDTFGIWGIVRTTTYYSLWTLLPGGVRYPLQVDREWNGVSQSSATITKIVVNHALDAAQFAIPDAVRTAFASASPAAAGVAALRFDPSKVNDLAPGVIQFSGAWNVALVHQPDGIVIVEAPIGSSYSASVIAEAEKRYPGARVKAVITTSDAWPHLGGVREYVARGIPVYALDLNRPILERLLEADYSTHPDALAKEPRAPAFTWVSGKTAIGTGDTQVEIYPAQGENGERMLFVHLPAQKLLYSSDDIQKDRTGEYFMPEYLLEVRDAVRRYHLDVDRIFGMHVGPTPWSAIEAAIASASAVPSGASSSPRGR